MKDKNFLFFSANIMISVTCITIVEKYTIFTDLISQGHKHFWISHFVLIPFFILQIISVTFALYFFFVGAAVAEWLNSWLAEQEDRGSIPGLATWIFRDWLSPASKSRYGWKIAKSTLILKTTNQPMYF